jgi:hypothetical protein
MERKGITIVIVVVAVVVLIIFGIVAVAVGPTKLFDALTFWDKDDDDGSGNKTNGNGGNGNQNPIANIVVMDDTFNTSYEFAVSEVVWFDARGSVGTPNITQYMWEFGDDTTKQGAGEEYSLVNHSYARRGEYTINLTVVGSNKARGKTNVTITILGQPYVNTEIQMLSSRVGSSNATVSFPVEKDARNMTLDITATGLSQDISAKLEIEIYDPYHELMGNASLSFVLQDTAEFMFDPSEISNVGNYFIELSCKSGTMRVVIDIYVGY